jgi:hypothetical protein
MCGQCGHPTNCTDTDWYEPNLRFWARRGHHPNKQS